MNSSNGYASRSSSMAVSGSRAMMSSTRSWLVWQARIRATEPDHYLSNSGIRLCERCGVASPVLTVDLSAPKTSSVLIQRWNRVTSRDNDGAVLLRSQAALSVQEHEPA